MHIRPAEADLSLGSTAADHVDRCITIQHPGYTGANNILITLLAADGDEGGFDKTTLDTICSIIATNRSDGWLSTDIGGCERVKDDCQVVPPGVYYFHVPCLAQGSSPTPDGNSVPVFTRPDQPANIIGTEQPGPYRYPINPFFDSWRFPHENIPKIWHKAVADRAHNLRPSVQERDQTCRMTNRREGTELAHVIPKNEVAWFRRNTISRYGSIGQRVGTEAIDDSENVMLLRSDVHRLWDQRAFVLVPKRSHPSGEGVFVAHVMHESSEILALYHNVRTQRLAIPKEYLFARLAWAILAEARSFLQTDQPRALTIWNDEAGEFRTGTYSVKQCIDLLNSRARSRSPKRRRAHDNTEEPVDEDFEDFDDSRHRKRRRLHSFSDDGDSTVDSIFSESHAQDCEQTSVSASSISDYEVLVGEREYESPRESRSTTPPRGRSLTRTRNISRMVRPCTVSVSPCMKKADIPSICPSQLTSNERTLSR